MKCLNPSADSFKCQKYERGSDFGSAKHTQIRLRAQLNYTAPYTQFDDFIILNRKINGKLKRFTASHNINTAITNAEEKFNSLVAGKAYELKHRLNAVEKHWPHSANCDDTTAGNSIYFYFQSTCHVINYIV